MRETVTCRTGGQRERGMYSRHITKGVGEERRSNSQCENLFQNSRRRPIVEPSEVQQHLTAHYKGICERDKGSNKVNKDARAYERTIEEGEWGRLLAKQRWNVKHDWAQATAEPQRTASRLPKGKQGGADWLKHEMRMPRMVEGVHYRSEAVIRSPIEAAAPEYRCILRFDESKQPPKFGAAAVLIVQNDEGWKPVQMARMRLPEHRTVMEAESLGLLLGLHMSVHEHINYHVMIMGDSDSVVQQVFLPYSVHTQSPCNAGCSA